MEKFEINENGTLTAYHNDDKNVTEIIIPEGVKFIERHVFSEYGKIYSVVFPDSLENLDNWAFWCCFELSEIKYRGITFNPDAEMFKKPETVDMIANKNYSHVISHRIKYPVIFQIYFRDSDDVTTAYIKKHFREIFRFLINAVIFQDSYKDCITLENVLKITENLIKSGKFITKRNINTYIKIADEKECYEIFDMLIDYKEEVLK
ncbi:MAG: leucine-rich repeat domain-containing protein [Ruminococcus sp.]|nr:leucine-rich repeat domain-containing protein [Ruminococcus sp.]